MAVRKPAGSTAGTAREAMIASLNQLLADVGEPVVVRVLSARGRRLVSYRLDAPEGPPPQRGGKPHPLQALLFEILTQAHPARVTLPEIMAKIDGLAHEGGREWSERSVARVLGEIMDDGDIDNAKRDEGRGQGYGFPD